MMTSSIICRPIKVYDKEIMSIVMFNIVVDMWVVLIKRAKASGLVSGINPHLVGDGLSILQYVDDTIILLDHNLSQAINMKLLLTVFELLSRLKINFHKSEIFCYGKAKDH
jgi:hypothetical protein